MIFREFADVPAVFSADLQTRHVKLIRSSNSSDAALGWRGVRPVCPESKKEMSRTLPFDRESPDHSCTHILSSVIETSNMSGRGRDDDGVPTVYVRNLHAKTTYVFDFDPVHLSHSQSGIL
jgi:hypothetical protein